MFSLWETYEIFVDLPYRSLPPTALRQPGYKPACRDTRPEYGTRREGEKWPNLSAPGHTTENDRHDGVDDVLERAMRVSTSGVGPANGQCPELQAITTPTSKTFLEVHNGSKIWVVTLFP